MPSRGGGVAIVARTIGAQWQPWRMRAGLAQIQASRTTQTTPSLRIILRHQCIEQPRHQQRDREVNQRHRRRRPQIKLAQGDLHQVNRQQGGRIPRPPTSQNKRLRIDVETVHKAQQNRDGQNCLHLRQLNVTEHLPGRRPVNLGRLIVGIRDRHEARIAEQHNQRGPVPDVHRHNGDPGRQRAAGHVVLNAQNLVHKIAQEANIREGKDVPHRAHHVPRDQHRQGHGHQTHRHPDAFARHRQGDDNAQRHLDDQDQKGEQELPPQRIVKAIGTQDLLEPAQPFPEKQVVPKGFLHRVIDHRHDRDQRVEGHQQQHRQDKEPRLLVFGFHDVPSEANQPSR
mmetsp:Transcript_22313/g.35563  ORF Transcript_22313/g.35563 Transcript_22313/m.35563 type:complete len:341 (-) Transcript_22313:331-1353(-)